MTGASFLDITANIPEPSFGPPWSINVANNGGNFDLSVLACLTTGSVPADVIPGLLPFELLEDDGSTDIPGFVGHIFLQRQCGARARTSRRDSIVRAICSDCCAPQSSSLNTQQC